MKKKLLSLLVAVCMFVPCLVMLTACGNNVVGKYSLYSLTYGEITVTKDDLGAENLDPEKAAFIEMFGEEMFAATIELKDDNTAIMGGDGDEMTGTWSQDGDKITITLAVEEGDVDQTQVFTFADGKLSYSMGEGEEAVTMTFAKN